MRTLGKTKARTSGETKARTSGETKVQTSGEMKAQTSGETRTGKSSQGLGALRPSHDARGNSLEMKGSRRESLRRRRDSLGSSYQRFSAQ